MRYRVAFASTDGKVVNQHFGRASAFHIVDIDEEAADYKYVETREHTPVCVDFDHSEARLVETAKVLVDCRAVFVARIGSGARQVLKSRGIQGLEMPYYIEDIIDALLHSKVKIIQDMKL